MYRVLLLGVAKPFGVAVVLGLAAWAVNSATLGTDGGNPCVGIGLEF